MTDWPFDHMDVSPKRIFSLFDWQIPIMTNRPKHPFLRFFLTVIYIRSQVVQRQRGLKNSNYIRISLLRPLLSFLLSLLVFKYFPTSGLFAEAKNHIKK